MMTKRRTVCSPSFSGRVERGSAVIMTLLACLGVAICVQVLSVMVICGASVLREEALGREQLAERDQGLAALRSLALSCWGPTQWANAGAEGEEVEGRLTEIEGSLGWVLEAEVTQDTGAAVATACAWVERGRDGLDLPAAAVVATSVSAWGERVTPWLVGEVDGSSSGGQVGSPGVAYVGRCEGPALIGEGCEIKPLSKPWRLDEGWRAFLALEQPFGDRACVLNGSQGDVLLLPEAFGSESGTGPVLVVVVGGADLDARWHGDLCAVIVVDNGSLLLDGTTVTGSVIASGEVDLGLTGHVVFCKAVLRWATDVSLRRDRLAPGTRGEGTQ